MLPLESLSTSQLIALLFVAGGSVAFLITLIQLRRARLSTNWPTVSGTVKSARLEVERSRDGPMARALVNYDYEVKGRKFAGSRVAFGDFLATNLVGIAERRATQYRQGKQVTVYYDPDDPAKAVLQAGASAELCIAAAITAGAAIIGAIVMLFPGTTS